MYYQAQIQEVAGRFKTLYSREDLEQSLYELQRVNPKQSGYKFRKRDLQHMLEAVGITLTGEESISQLQQLARNIPRQKDRIHLLFNIVI